MNELAVVDRGADWHRLKSLVLDSVSSPITKRVYNLGLDEFFSWYGQEPRPGFTKATVAAWRVALEARGLGAVSINVRITAVRKLAVEAADNGLLAPELANGITRVKGVASKGVRLGNWLTAKQAQALLNAPDVNTIKGLRDRAILAVLLGCGLRRSEVAALTFKHIQQRDGRWCIVDLVGKHGRVRTVPMPTWVKVSINAWATPAGIADGAVFRSVNRGGEVYKTALSEKVIWQLTRARALAERANEIFLKQGWAVDWSGNGSVKELEARWSSVNLKQALKRDAEVDIPKLRGIALENAASLRRVLTRDPVDPANMTASSIYRYAARLCQPLLRSSPNRYLRRVRRRWHFRDRAA